jgi:hypothetical protein
MDTKQIKCPLPDFNENMISYPLWMIYMYISNSMSPPIGAEYPEHGN